MPFLVKNDCYGTLKNKTLLTFPFLEFRQLTKNLFYPTFWKLCCVSLITAILILEKFNLFIFLNMKKVKNHHVGWKLSSFIYLFFKDHETSYLLRLNIIFKIKYGLTYSFNLQNCIFNVPYILVSLSKFYGYF